VSTGLHISPSFRNKIQHSSWADCTFSWTKLKNIDR
jgi:hypothetical protein